MCIVAITCAQCSRITCPYLINRKWSMWTGSGWLLCLVCTLWVRTKKIQHAFRLFGNHRMCYGKARRRDKWEVQWKAWYTRRAYNTYTNYMHWCVSCLIFVHIKHVHTHTLTRARAGNYVHPNSGDSVCMCGKRIAFGTVMLLLLLLDEQMSMFIYQKNIRYILRGPFFIRNVIRCRLVFLKAK